MTLGIIYAIYLPIVTKRGVIALMVKTRVFDLGYRNYRNLSDLAQAMGISVSQVYRVRGGKRGINQRFIVGAIKAFPERRLDDLFYLASEEPIMASSNKR